MAPKRCPAPCLPRLFRIKRQPFRVLILKYSNVHFSVEPPRHDRLFKFGRQSPSLLPPQGLCVSNHLSNLDPFAIGLAIRCRHLVYIAKADLFKNPIASFIFRGVNCVPIKQGAPDTAAIRAAIDRLTGGSAVLIFPEGSRSPDGAMHPFKRGAWLVFARTECDVLPVAVEGTFDAFPRGRSTPRVGMPIRVKIGQVIPRATLSAMKPDAGLEYLAERIEALRLELAKELKDAGATLTTKPRSMVELDDAGLIKPDAGAAGSTTQKSAPA